MATSVYDWMLIQKHPSLAKDENAKTASEDVLVRLLKALDAEATKAPLSST